MVSVYDDLMRTIFLDPHEAQDGETYTDINGRQYTPITVIQARASEFDPLLGSAGVRQPVLILDVLQTQIPWRPREGETITFRGALYRVRSGEADTLHTRWRLDLDPT